MAITFVSGGSGNVDIGSAAALDDIRTGCIIILAKPPASPPGNDNGVVTKRSVTVGWTFIFGQATSEVHFDLDGTTPLLVESSGNVIVSNAWGWAAVNWDFGAAATSQKLYYSSLYNPLAEVGAYGGGRSGGVGATSDAAVNVAYGNSRDPGVTWGPFVGDLARVSCHTPR